MAVDLTTAAGRAELELAIALVATINESDPVRRASKLRNVLDPALAGLALSQFELRGKAETKFGTTAATMYFTRTGLEQSSRIEVADHRAARFATAGVTEVLDLCSGIGADSLAFARAGLTVTSVERDPETAAILAANLPGHTVMVASAEETAWQHVGSVFIDPARRSSAGRVFDPAAYSPRFDFVLDVLGSRFAAAKLAPGLAHDLVPAGIEAEWVSFAGAVKEAVLWSAGFAQVDRRATVLSRTGATQLTDADPSAATVGEIGAYLYEPDGAVIRAGLVQQVAALLPGGRRIDEHLAYLSADAAVSTPLATGFEVMEVLPFSVDRLRAALQEREVGIVEIKKRGVDVDPAQLRRQLKPRGPNSITVLLARVGDRHLAILAQRV
jgi:THUMP domain-like